MISTLRHEETKIFQSIPMFIVYYLVQALNVLAGRERDYKNKR